MAESRFWEGFLIGGLVGVAAGLLFAPQSGAEARKTVAKAGSQVKEAVGQAYKAAASEVAGAVGTLREAVTRGREVAVEVTSQLGEEMEERSEA